jgi:hypothetical protein
MGTTISFHLIYLSPLSLVCDIYPASNPKRTCSCADNKMKRKSRFVHPLSWLVQSI